MTPFDPLALRRAPMRTVVDSLRTLRAADQADAMALVGEIAVDESLRLVREGAHRELVDAVHALADALSGPAGQALSTGAEGVYATLSGLLEQLLAAAAPDSKGAYAMTLRSWEPHGEDLLDALAVEGRIARDALQRRLKMDEGQFGTMLIQMRAGGLIDWTQQLVGRSSSLWPTRLGREVVNGAIGADMLSCLTLRQRLLTRTFESEAAVVLVRAGLLPWTPLEGGQAVSEPRTFVAERVGEVGGWSPPEPHEKALDLPIAADDPPLDICRWLRGVARTDAHDRGDKRPTRNQEPFCGGVGAACIIPAWAVLRSGQPRCFACVVSDGVGDETAAVLAAVIARACAQHLASWESPRNGSRRPSSGTVALVPAA